MILVLISEVIGCTAKSVLIHLIIVLKPYVICVNVNVHLVRKIMVQLLVPLKLRGLFWFLIILEIETRHFQFLINTTHSIVHHVCEDEVACSFVRFLFQWHLSVWLTLLQHIEKVIMVVSQFLICQLCPRVNIKYFIDLIFLILFKTIVTVKHIYYLCIFDLYVDLLLACIFHLVFLL